jgi:hypothetical protein
MVKAASQKMKIILGVIAHAATALAAFAVGVLLAGLLYALLPAKEVESLPEKSTPGVVHVLADPRPIGLGRETRERIQIALRGTPGVHAFKFPEVNTWLAGGRRPAAEDAQGELWKAVGTPIVLRERGGRLHATTRVSWRTPVGTVRLAMQAEGIFRAGPDGVRFVPSSLYVNNLAVGSFGNQRQRLVDWALAVSSSHKLPDEVVSRLSAVTINPEGLVLVLQ